ncbi:MAG: hypothetical protein GC206_09085 [Alphaproteobacteria bacterium]|nr:hypothetical protein [Alphaproteobacteria bacterium]
MAELHELPARPTPRRVEAVSLPAGDYVSPGFWTIMPDAAFPNMRIGDTNMNDWPYLRRTIRHNWYVDQRHPTVGFVNRDEASILYNSARLFRGMPCLEIGCWRGWSTAHILAGSGQLDVFDPALADPAFRADVMGSIERAGVADGCTMHVEYSPAGVEAFAERTGVRWSMIFIDGDHEAPGPLKDAVAADLYAAPDAMILFHDLLSPDVSEGLAYLRSRGWNTVVFQTAQIMGAAWRGDAAPVEHRPDPTQRWDLPEHLHSFAVSGEMLQERTARWQDLIERQARSAPKTGAHDEVSGQETASANEIEELRQNLARAAERMRDQAKRQRERTEALEAEIETHRNETQRLNAALAALSETPRENARLITRMQMLAGLVSASSEESAALRSREAALTQTLAETAHERDMLAARILEAEQRAQAAATLEKQAKLLHVEVERMRASLLLAGTAAERSDREAAEALARLGRAEAERASAEERFTEIQAQLNEAAQKLSESDAFVAYLERRLGVSEEEILQLTHRLSVAEAASKHAGEALRAALEAAEGARQERAQATAEVGPLKAHRDVIMAALVEASSAKLDQEAEIGRLNHRIHELNQQLEAVFNSRSWRAMAVVRKGTGFARRVYRGLRRRAGAMLRRMGLRR